MKKIFICFIILFSSLILAQDKSNLVYKESIYSVKIELENGNDFIELDKENVVQIVSKNIDPLNMMFSGIGVKIANKTNVKNKTSLIIKPNKESVKDGFYTLNFSFRGNKGRHYTNQFFIRIKE
ncbi:hypothetical protein [Flavobacterium difficile]|uniref:Uncharacterized protein n=1 Tax=Flavobacterium difficile TaxID=2709659 RepID=A0ABX0I2R3_9FLAO|nr:hypothetical protein [Flavobacterium difficile]NHM01031.1 hypothetical protein [Flavobacterium difficile]